MVSLIHPSRGRAAKAYVSARNWMAKSKSDFANERADIEHIVTVDEDDRELAEYMRLFPLQNKGQIVIGRNSSVVEATNGGAKRSNGDILLYLSDDFDCPDNWVQGIEDATKDAGPIWLLKVDDCLQKFEVPVLTIPIMSRGLYEKLGYFWHPGYKSMFVDEDLYWTCKKLNCIINAPHLKFPHEHCSVGKAAHDETYRRSEANWNQGKEFFAKRKQQNFPL